MIGIRQFDTTYNTFFYINPTTNPPITSWTHPNFLAGQAAPEQVQAMQSGHQQGTAIDYTSSASTDTPVHGQYPSGPGVAGSQDPGVQAGAGERGMGTNMAMNMVMGKLGMGGNHGNGGYGGGGYGQSSGGGASAMVGKLASSLLGGKTHQGGHNSYGNNYNSNSGHNQYSSAGNYNQPQGAPPFMSGGSGSGGGLGGILNSVLGGGKQHGQGGQNGSGGGLGGILSTVLGGGKQHGQGQGQGGYGGQQYAGQQTYGGQGGYGQPQQYVHQGQAGAAGQYYGR